ncbi:hypothetical protein ACFL2Q_15210 [Thermodesulfobacteriota bacterium]
MIARFTRKDFLEALFSNYYKEHRGFILVKSVKQGDPKWSTRYFPNVDILAKEHYGEERDVYFGVCPRERMKAEKEHIRYLVCLWADLDIGREGHETKEKYFEGPQQAARAIRSFPRAPSIIVESGRGAHLYWLLKDVTEVEDPEKIEDLLAKISEHLNCETDSNIDATLRLPETVNTKIPANPLNCEVKFINTNFRYTLKDFENLGRDAAQSASPPPASAPVPEPPPQQYVEDASPAPPAPPGEPVSGIHDSLIVDETIMDELVDDMSMTTSVVADSIMPEDYSVAPPGMGDPEPPRPLHAVHAPAAPVPMKSAFLERLSADRVQVEVTVMGSEETISGIILWTENSLMGVQSGTYMYTIPLSSVSFIKTEI